MTQVEQLICIGGPVALLALFVLVRVVKNIDPRGGKW